MSQRCYYEVLGVTRTAEFEEIRRAYRKKALEYHPDRNPDNEEAEALFKEAAEAYDVLRDEEKRGQYDRFGHAGLNGQRGGFASNDDIFSHFGDIFSDLFGFSMGGPRAGRNRAQRGADLRYNLAISFRQAAKGDTVTIKIPRHVLCGECNGSRSAKGTKPTACPQCQGLGQVRHNQGFFQISVPCPRCQGEGMIISNPCSACSGAGVQREMRTLSVTVPAGVDTGNRLRLRAEGEAGHNGGPNGDLYVVLQVEDDKTFTRDGQNLLVEQKLSFPQAALGAKIEVPTLDDPIVLDIPKGTQNGEVFRIAQKGLPYPNQRRHGDLLVGITVLTPENLTAKQEELLRQFAVLEEKKPLNKAKKIIKKMGKAMGMND